MLHISNGDSATTLLQQAGVSGDLLPWRDVLHAGPINHADLDTLSRQRAAFIVEHNWGPKLEVHHSFQQRDARFKASVNDDKVILWFEHDLYDQLQLIQILNWYAEQTTRPEHIFLVQTDHYLAEMTITQIKKLLNTEQPVTTEQFLLAHRAWNALCDDSPLSWQHLLTQNTDTLPYLNDAILRFLQELPSALNGLSRTEQQTLAVLIEKGPLTAGNLFSVSQAHETARFLGDSQFWESLTLLASGRTPLIEITPTESHAWPNNRVTINQTGVAVFNGHQRKSTEEMFHLWRPSNPDFQGPEWYWDSQAQHLCNAQTSAHEAFLL